jgi:hypothetical protein
MSPRCESSFATPQPGALGRACVKLAAVDFPKADRSTGRSGSTSAAVHIVQSLRQRVIQELEFLGSAEKQRAYEASLTRSGDARTELVAVFCDDLFDLKSTEFTSAFSRDELKWLAHFYGVLLESRELRAGTIVELQKLALWRRVMHLAQEIAAQLRN